MDIHRALFGYIERIVGEVDGMKVLLVDKETVCFYIWCSCHHDKLKIIIRRASLAASAHNPIYCNTKSF